MTKNTVTKGYYIVFVLVLKNILNKKAIISIKEKQTTLSKFFFESFGNEAGINKSIIFSNPLYYNVAPYLLS